MNRLVFGLASLDCSIFLLYNSILLLNGLVFLLSCSVLVLYGLILLLRSSVLVLDSLVLFLDSGIFLLDGLILLLRGSILFLNRLVFLLDGSILLLCGLINLQVHVESLLYELGSSRLEAFLLTIQVVKKTFLVFERLDIFLGHLDHIKFALAIDKEAIEVLVLDYGHEQDFGAFEVLKLQFELQGSLGLSIGG